MDLQELFLSLQASDLRDWIRDGKQEDLHLDFKRLTGAPDFSRDDKRNLATALSGFANSDGGLIVWGVDCRKGEDGIDCARAIVPIANVARVLGRLHSLTGEATVPRLVNVQHRAIFESGATAGVIVTVVHPSDVGPHMAKLGEDRYFKRSGESFYRMEHFDLSDMFGRRLVPNLRLVLTGGMAGVESIPGVRSASVQGTVRIENSGRGIAKFPFLRIRSNSPYGVAHGGLDGSRRFGLPAIVQSAHDSDWHVFAGGNDHVVHPGCHLDVTLVRGKVTEYVENLEDMIVEYQLAAEGQLPIFGTVRLPGADLLSLAKEHIERSFPKRP